MLQFSPELMMILSNVYFLSERRKLLYASAANTQKPHKKNVYLICMPYITNTQLLHFNLKSQILCKQMLTYPTSWIQIFYQIRITMPPSGFLMLEYYYMFLIAHAKRSFVTSEKWEWILFVFLWNISFFQDFSPQNCSFFSI